MSACTRSHSADKSGPSGRCTWTSTPSTAAATRRTRNTWDVARADAICRSGLPVGLEIGRASDVTWLGRAVEIGRQGNVDRRFRLLVVVRLLLQCRAASRFICRGKWQVHALLPSVACLPLAGATLDRRDIAEFGPRWRMDCGVALSDVRAMEAVEAEGTADTAHYEDMHSGKWQSWRGLALVEWHSIHHCPLHLQKDTSLSKRVRGGVVRPLTWTHELKQRCQ